MTTYNVTIEVATSADMPHDAIDDLMGQLASYHAAVSRSAVGNAVVTVSLPAEHIAQAVMSAVAVVEAAAGAATVSVEAMTSAEFDRRQGWDASPETLTVGQVAEALGVTRQAVLDRIRRGTLPATKVGRDYAVPAGAVPRRS